MKKQRISFLSLLGLMLIAAGLLGLYHGPEISQYTFLPDSSADYAEMLAQTEEKWEGVFPAVSLHGTAGPVSLSAGSKTQGEVTLLETLGGYFEVYPRRFSAGRPLTRGDGKDRVIVLDASLAFQLFGDQDPLDQEVALGEKKFRVVGTAEHSRGVGDSGDFMAWIPLGADGAPEARIMTLSAGGGAGSGLRTVFENGAGETFGPGQAIFLGKERTRGTVLLRFVIVAIALRLLAVWIRYFRQLAGGWASEIRERLKTSYPRQLWGLFLSRGTGMLLGAALTIVAGAGLVVWCSRLMMIFPEWVPEVLVDPESIAQRFRELTSVAASPLRFNTPELAEIRFWSGMIRWGTVLALTGEVIRRRGDKT